MGPKGTLRAIEAAARRAERDAQRRQRELARQAKEEAKLSELERARLEVETYENKIEILLSIHRERGKTWDWPAVLASLPPAPPVRLTTNELRARQTFFVLPPERRQQSGTLIDQGRWEDDRYYEKRVQSQREQVAEWGHLRRLARLVLSGEPKAYTEALTELSAFDEISDLGSSIHVTVHTPKFLECFVKVNGKQIIPDQVKSLTSTGKVSVKAMPKGRFQEIYADYLCGCVFRVAREIFAVIPADTVLVTATADSMERSTGHQLEKPVLSVAFPRAQFSALDFERLDPSDAVENFQHRANFQGNRKTEPFEAITPLSPTEVLQQRADEMPLPDLVAKSKLLTEQLRNRTSELRRGPAVELTEPEPEP